MARQDLTLDQYAPLSHKRGVGDGTTTQTALMAPMWVPEAHRRRLAAYRVLHAATLNVARHFFDTSPTLHELGAGRVALAEDDTAAMVEYGDAALLVARLVAAILGDTLTVDVDGADVDPLPHLPPAPEPAPDDATDVERRVAAVALARWERDAATVVDEWEAAIVTQPQRAALRAALREWADTEAIASTLRLATGDAVALGDGVIAIGWDPAKQRPTWRRYDPGFYFPVHDPGSDPSEFPSTVHVAWEEEHPTAAGTARYVRRQTWRLVNLPAPVTYPWNDAPTTLSCVYSDGRWPVEKLNGAAVDGFGDESVEWITEPMQLGVDFVPVIHVPGVDVGDDYGMSMLAPLIQLLDEIISTDTDVSKAQALAAGPAIALAGAAAADTLTVEPGAVYDLGAEGSMSVLDLSAGLSELRATLLSLLERLSVNAQVPAEVLGRVVAGTELSGVAIALRFGPFRQLVEAVRLVHRRKWDLAMKMTARTAVANGMLDAEAAEPTVRLVPGTFLPADTAGAVETVARARGAGIVSQETAVQMLAAVGVPVADAAREVAAIRAADPAGAKAVYDAVGEEAAADWLGVDPPPSPPQPNLGLGES